MAFRSPQDALEELARKNSMELQNNEAVINSAARNIKLEILSNISVFATYFIGCIFINLLTENSIIVIACILMNMFISMFFIINYLVNIFIVPLTGLYIYTQQIGAMNSGKLNETDSENIKSDFCAAVTARVPSGIIYSEAISRIVFSIAWGGVWRVGVISFPWLIAFSLRPPA